MTSLDVLEKTLNAYIHAYECKITFLSCLYALRGIIVASSSQKCILGYDRMYLYFPFLRVEMCVS